MNFPIPGSDIPGADLACDGAKASLEFAQELSEGVGWSRKQGIWHQWDGDGEALMVDDSDHEKFEQGIVLQSHWLNMLNASWKNGTSIPVFNSPWLKWAVLWEPAHLLTRHSQWQWMSNRDDMKVERPWSSHCLMDESDMLKANPWITNRRTTGTYEQWAKPRSFAVYRGLYTTQLYYRDHNMPL